MDPVILIVVAIGAALSAATVYFASLDDLSDQSEPVRFEDKRR